MVFLTQKNKLIWGCLGNPAPPLPIYLGDSFSASLFIDLADVNLAFKNANSKFLNVVSFADVVAEESVDDSLVEILKLRFGRDFKPEIWSRY